MVANRALFNRFLVIFVMFLNLIYNVNFYRNLIFFRYLGFCHTKRRFCYIVPFLVEVQISKIFVNIKFLVIFGITPCVYRRSDWHWGTQSIIEWQEPLLSLKTHKTSGYVTMVIKVHVFLSQKGSEVFDTQIISHQNFIYNGKKKYWPTSYKRIYF